jgi:hypothetical protein
MHWRGSVKIATLSTRRLSALQLLVILQVLTVSSTTCVVPFSKRPTIDRSTHPIYNEALHAYKKNASIRPSGGANSVSRVSSASSPGRQSPVAPWTDAMAHTTDDSADAANFRFDNLHAGLSTDIGNGSTVLLNAQIPRRSRSSEITVPPLQASLYGLQATDSGGAEPQPGSPSHPSYALSYSVPDGFPVVDRMVLRELDQHAWIDVTSSMERSDLTANEGLRSSPRSPRFADSSADTRSTGDTASTALPTSTCNDGNFDTVDNTRRATAGVGALLSMLRQAPPKAENVELLATLPLRRPREKSEIDQAGSPTKKLRTHTEEATGGLPSSSTNAIGRSSPSALALLQDYDDGEISSVGVT